MVGPARGESRPPRAVGGVALALFRTTWRGRRLRDLDLAAALADPAQHRPYIRFMFDLLAPGYDLFTRIFSFGMDRGWKRTVLAELARRAPEARCVIDLACGTGDLAAGARRSHPRALVVGMDVAAEMVRAARTRGTTQLVVGDLLQLGLRADGVDAVTVGYGLRNVPDHMDGLREIHRVLRPGALLVTLDFYRPARDWWRRVFLAYLRGAGALIGWLWHGEPGAYAYIAPSIDRFVTAAAFSRALETTGFVVQRVHRRLGGGVAIHVATKRRGETAAGAGSPSGHSFPP